MGNGAGPVGNGAGSVGNGAAVVGAAYDPGVVALPLFPPYIGYWIEI